ncbi:MAG: right-handed parallel beta-helix repeat-containing protein [Puniceicoccaceae bacterium]|nr:MAG: right-handed parallel beta-helix repeat-containing protein [Puniceicoccaceae bacterium]
MVGVSARGLRHAPNVQWSSSGNVFRDSRFEDSGGQWHAGYATENLYENLHINSTGREGSYAYALFSSIPNGMHGPQGPRNVVRNCTVISHRGGIKLGGFNEGWIFTHNRVLARKGPALVILPGAQNLRFQENIFVTLSPDPAPVWIATEDCVGLEFEGNTFLGVGTAPVFAGGGKPARVSKQVEVRDLLSPSGLPSLHDWQRAQPDLPPVPANSATNRNQTNQSKTH